MWSYYNHTYGVRHVASNWMYSSSLNYYRAASGRETLMRFPGAILRPGTAAVRVELRIRQRVDPKGRAAIAVSRRTY